MQLNWVFLSMFLGGTAGVVHTSHSLRGSECGTHFTSDLELRDRRLGFQNVQMLSSSKSTVPARGSICLNMAADGGKATGKGFGKSSTTKARPSTVTKSRQTEAKKAENDDYFELLNDALSKKTSKNAGKKKAKQDLSIDSPQAVAKADEQLTTDARKADPVKEAAPPALELKTPATPSAERAEQKLAPDASGKVFQAQLKLEAADDLRQALAAERLQQQLRLEAAADRARAAAAAEMHVALRGRQAAQAPPQDPSSEFNELFAANEAQARKEEQAKAQAQAMAAAEAEREATAAAAEAEAEAAAKAEKEAAAAKAKAEAEAEAAA